MPACVGPSGAHPDRRQPPATVDLIDSGFHRVLRPCLFSHRIHTLPAEHDDIGANAARPGDEPGMRPRHRLVRSIGLCCPGGNGRDIPELSFGAARAVQRPIAAKVIVDERSQRKRPAASAIFLWRSALVSGGRPEDGASARRPDARSRFGQRVTPRCTATSARVTTTCARWPPAETFAQGTTAAGDGERSAVRGTTKMLALRRGARRPAGDLVDVDDG
jgi:hypothetical protein